MMCNSITMPMVIPTLISAMTNASMMWTTLSSGCLSSSQAFCAAQTDVAKCTAVKACWPTTGSLAGTFLTVCDQSTLIPAVTEPLCCLIPSMGTSSTGTKSSTTGTKSSTKSSTSYGFAVLPSFSLLLSLFVMLQ